MKDFDKYLARSKRISDSVEKSGNGLGMTISWLMIAVGVVVTAIQTHSLAYNGMKGSKLYEDWLDVASWLPVVLLEGTAIGLTLGRLYFFKGSEQRRLGFVASFAVWGAWPSTRWRSSPSATVTAVGLVHRNFPRRCSSMCAMSCRFR
jgi:hypothetical protein